MPSRRTFLLSGLSTLVAGSTGCRKKKEDAATDDLLAGALGNNSGNANSSSESGTTSKAWTSDARFAAQLGVPTEAFGFVIRPPKIFTQTMWLHDDLTGWPAACWGMPHTRHPSETIFKGTKFLVFGGAVDNSRGLPRTPQEYIDLCFKWYKKLLRIIDETETQSGVVNGIPFLRKTLSAQMGHDATIDVLIHVGLEGHKLAGIHCFTHDRETPNVLRLVEESCLTLRRYSGGPVRLFLTSGKADKEPASPREKIIGCGLAPTPFKDVGPNDGILIGFDIGLTRSDRPEIAAVQPLYRADGKEFRGRLRGTQNVPMSRIMAKAGYAVGRLNVTAPIVLGGFKIRFMKLVGDQLNPAEAYETIWIGSQQEWEHHDIGDGTPLIGIRGFEDTGPLNPRLTGLGLVYRDEEG